MATKLELKNKVPTRVDDDIDSDLLDDWFDSIYFRILTDKTVFWKFLEGKTTFATVDGQTDYAKSSIAADLDMVYDLYTDNNIITNTVNRDFDEAMPSPTASGEPTRYTEWGDVIRLYPTPDATYDVNVRYYKKCAEPLADGDEPVIPIEFQEVLVLGMQMMFYEWDEDDTRYQRKVVEFENYLSKMRKSQETKPDEIYTLRRRTTRAVQLPDYNSSHKGF